MLCVICKDGEVLRFKKLQQCKLCYARIYRAKTRDRDLAKMRVYKEAYRQRNLEKERERCRVKGRKAWADNPNAAAEQREKLRRFEENNPGRIAARSAGYSSRRRSRMGEPTPEEFLLIREIYKKCKEITTSTGIKHEVDHHFPLAGCCPGKHHPDNLRILTKSENQSKGKKCPLHERRRYVVA